MASERPISPTCASAALAAANDGHAPGYGRLLALEGPQFLRLVGYGPGLSSRLIDLYRGVTALRR